MAAHLIEIPHSDNVIECNQAIKVFLESGSHLLANADWGCQDGVHKAWIIVDVENKEQALRIVPPFYRERASIIRTNKYTLAGMEDNIKLHKH
jgi:hypothetical protein